VLLDPYQREESEPACCGVDWLYIAWVLVYARSP
jgi:hypothetical protein